MSLLSAEGVISKVIEKSKLEYLGFWDLRVRGSLKPARQAEETRTPCRFQTT
jgi:hypothetical protein